MAPRVKLTVVAMLLALALMAVAVVWGAVFAFPEPDASGERVSQLQFHARLSGWLMLVSMVLFALAGAYGLWSSLRSRANSQKRAQPDASSGK